MARAVLFVLLLLLVTLATVRADGSLLEKKKKHKKWTFIPSNANLNGLRRPIPGVPRSPTPIAGLSINGLLNARNAARGIATTAKNVQLPVGQGSALLKARANQVQAATSMALAASLFDSNFLPTSLVNLIPPEELNFELVLLSRAAYEHTLPDGGKVSTYMEVPMREKCRKLQIWNDYESAGMRFIILYDADLKAVFIVFRGGDNDLNVMQDLKTAQLDCIFKAEKRLDESVQAKEALESLSKSFSNGGDQVQASTANGLCHEGFLQTYNRLRGQLLSSLLSLSGKSAIDPLITTVAKATPFKVTDRLEIYLTGHSLGGATAVLATLDISQNPDLRPAIASMYLATAGQPLVGDARFVETFSKSLLGSPMDKMANQGPEFPVKYVRLVTNLDRTVDPISMVPFESWNYRHIAEQTPLHCDSCAANQVDEFHSLNKYIRGARLALQQRTKNRPIASCKHISISNMDYLTV